MNFHRLKTHARPSELLQWFAWSCSEISKETLEEVYNYSRTIILPDKVKYMVVVVMNIFVEVLLIPERS